MEAYMTMSDRSSGDSSIKRRLVKELYRAKISMEE